MKDILDRSYEMTYQYLKDGDPKKLAKVKDYERITDNIQKEVKSIFNYLNDFHNWPQWSPWLIADPNTSLNIDTDGKYYIWEGDVTGSGDMRVLSETKNKSLSCSLNFYKPWKSKVEVDFYLEEKSDGTKVAWTMKSSLPWFLFWMKKSMEVYVGMGNRFWLMSPFR